MLDREEPGAIVNTASISSVDAQPGQVAYDATKGAIRMITRGAAVELAPEGIRVNAVAPGVVATEFGSSGSAATEEAVAAGETTKPVPLGRAGRPEDVAGSALFLASEDAAYVTGELLFVDGGYHAL
jgi:NAD(P)-dependent dehydrogenase (short-subunit alcohol dehydrogenase family)